MAMWEGNQRRGEERKGKEGVCASRVRGLFELGFFA